jgi:hypothetical protein
MFNKINISLECKSKDSPIDYELKNLDECYLTIHNFISIKSNSNVSDVKTYIYSATRPFLIELINNATQDCLCCPNNFNQHLNQNYH